MCCHQTFNKPSLSLSARPQLFHAFIIKHMVSPIHVTLCLSLYCIKIIIIRRRKTLLSQSFPKYCWMNKGWDCNERTAEQKMARCARCCLQNSIRIVNLITFMLAIGMIIYSLWLQKKWNDGVAQLPTTVYSPRPWLSFHPCLVY